MVKANGYGRLTKHRKDMETFDELPPDIRKFVSSVDASLSVVHFASRYKKSTAKGESKDLFFTREVARLKKYSATLPSPPQQIGASSYGSHITKL